MEKGEQVMDYAELMMRRSRQKEEAEAARLKAAVTIAKPGVKANPEVIPSAEAPTDPGKVNTTVADSCYDGDLPADDVPIAQGVKRSERLVQTLDNEPKNKKARTGDSLAQAVGAASEQQVKVKEVPPSALAIGSTEKVGRKEAPLGRDVSAAAGKQKGKAKEDALPSQVPSAAVERTEKMRTDAPPSRVANAAVEQAKKTMRTDAPQTEAAASGSEQGARRRTI